MTTLQVLKNKGRNRSHYSDLNYLAKKGNIYVMDNHLAAFYCWTVELDPKAKYSLLHIDRHHDLSEALVKEGFHSYKTLDLKALNLEQHLALRANNLQLQVWDNYIELYNAFCPLNIISYDFITPQRLPKRYKIYKKMTLKRWINKQLTVQEMMEVELNLQPQRIINLDIDVFFSKEGNRKVVSIKDLTAFCEKLKLLIPNAKLITIALSPELCGGWAESLKMYNLMNEMLDLDFELNI